jgi:hypothetical protein
MALVAATTLGLGAVERTRAEVSAAEPLATGSRDGYRLIVQSYSKASVGKDSVPGLEARPLASAQRAVTPEELARGVAIDVLQVGEAATLKGPIVVAWVEQGAANLDFDARRARPSEGAVYGAAETTDGTVQIVLRRRHA